MTVASLPIYTNFDKKLIESKTLYNIFIIDDGLKSIAPILRGFNKGLFKTLSNTYDRSYLQR